MGRVKELLLIQEEQNYIKLEQKIKEQQNNTTQNKGGIKNDIQ